MSLGHIFVSYKERGNDQSFLDTTLPLIKQHLTRLWWSSFIRYIDLDELGAQQHAQLEREQLERADMVLCIHNHEELSEGMTFELGLAYGRDKRIVVLRKAGISPRENSIDQPAERLIIYQDEAELVTGLTTLFWW